MTQNDTLSRFLDLVRRGDSVEFEETLEIIAIHYHYTPQAFWNGLGSEVLHNPPGTNEGSLKIFSFAAHHHLTEAQTLELFGKYYRDHVLAHPDGKDHLNIRTFMKTGWSGIRFAAPALSPR